MPNDPDVLKWLDSEDGQSWLNIHHHSVNYNEGFGKIVRAVPCGLYNDGDEHQGCSGINEFFAWIQTRQIIDAEDNFLTGMDWRDDNRVDARKLPPLTDEIIRRGVA